jgi:hypothetical protein
MRSFDRPVSHPQHALEAQRLLNELRQDVNNNRGVAKEVHFEKRAMWTASWTTPAKTWRQEHGTLQKGAYKRALVGETQLHVRAKCAWCEQLFEWKGGLEVDHYRPKCETTEWSSDAQQISVQRPTVSGRFPGFWWLAYSWDNWLLCCKPCNTWKGTFFPRHGPTPRHEEGVEQRDAALLIDPASSFVTREHFRWDINGYVDGCSERGTATIITCGLNREPLQNARSKALRDLFAELQTYLNALTTSNGNDISASQKRLATLAGIDAEFTSMIRWWIEECFRKKFDRDYTWDDLQFQQT